MVKKRGSKSMMLKSNGNPTRPSPPERRHDGEKSIAQSRKWAFQGKVPMEANKLQQT